MKKTKEDAIREAQEYFNKYSKYKLERKGTQLKVRVVALYHDSMGNKYAEPNYAWHDYSDDVFCKYSWSDEPTVMIIE